MSAELSNAICLIWGAVMGMGTLIGANWYYSRFHVKSLEIRKLEQEVKKLNRRVGALTGGNGNG